MGHDRPPAGSGFNRRARGGHDRPPAGSGFTRRTNQSEVERQSGSSQDKATRGRTGNSEHHEGAVA